ncbi:hypothetical protein OB919_12105 [Halobacteria archaeon AArc-curdl1]|uniref:Uncharacterized protein n=1 Tax=Natronosalvus hydrolyticus TaxID=2979988 RepID=A0AAP3E7Y3_9EURY|nr:hypothetical protein [Halobacteria archaeon AArc-curdl1]
MMKMENNGVENESQFSIDQSTVKSNGGPGGSADDDDTPWNVNDGTRDLELVTIELIEDDTTIDTETEYLTGESGSGTTKVKPGGNNPDTMRLTIGTEQGNETTEERDV